MCRSIWRSVFYFICYEYLPKFITINSIVRFRWSRRKSEMAIRPSSKWLERYHFHRLLSTLGWRYIDWFSKGSGRIVSPKKHFDCLHKISNESKYIAANEHRTVWPSNWWSKIRIQFKCKQLQCHIRIETCRVNRLIDERTHTHPNRNEKKDEAKRAWRTNRTANHYYSFITQHIHAVCLCSMHYYMRVVLLCCRFDSIQWPQLGIDQLPTQMMSDFQSFNDQMTVWWIEIENKLTRWMRGQSIKAICAHIMWWCIFIIVFAFFTPNTIFTMNAALYCIHFSFTFIHTNFFVR